MANQKPRPRNRKEFMNTLVDPYDTKTGNTNQVFSEPQKLGQPELNRAKENSFRKETTKDFYIGILRFTKPLLFFKSVLMMG